MADYLTRYPGLDPVWDVEWRRQKDGCVDLWIKWDETDSSIDVSLEHWSIHQLAEKYGDKSSTEALEAALSGFDDLQGRVEVIATLLEKSLALASGR